MTATGRRTVVLDDDPTGSQEVSGVPVLLRQDRRLLTDLLRRHEAVFVLTNSRALPEAEAVALTRTIVGDIEGAAGELGVAPLVVQRGDSTLRGHVFAEIAAAAPPHARVLFSPAFPGGGRRTRDGVHEVRVDGVWRNAADTEFARDPVFGFTGRSMVDYVAEKAPGRAVRCCRVTEVAEALRALPAGGVVVPDVVRDEDVADLAAVVLARTRARTSLIVRSAATLAAELCGARSSGLMTGPPVPAAGPVLVVVGSHTAATSAQLERLVRRRAELVVVDTAGAVRDPTAAGREAGERVASVLDRAAVAVVATERERDPTHGLAEADRVMSALTEAVRTVGPRVSAVVAKGGITSAEVARRGFGIDVGTVLGQLAPGISLWSLPGAGTYPTGGDLPYVVVPGNMGGPDTLVEIVDLLRGG